MLDAYNNPPMAQSMAAVQFWARRSQRDASVWIDYSALVLFVVLPTIGGLLGGIDGFMGGLWEGSEGCGAAHLYYCGLQ